MDNIRPLLAQDPDHPGNDGRDFSWIDTAPILRKRDHPAAFRRDPISVLVHSGCDCDFKSRRLRRARHREEMLAKPPIFRNEKKKLWHQKHRRINGRGFALSLDKRAIADERNPSGVEHVFSTTYVALSRCSIRATARESRMSCRQRPSGTPLSSFAGRGKRPASSCRNSPQPTDTQVQLSTVRNNQRPIRLDFASSRSHESGFEARRAPAPKGRR